MWVKLAYLGVVLIWSTTPLAIKFSSVGGGVLFSLMARMVLGALLCGVTVVVLRLSVPWHRGALRTYFSASIGLYFAMLLVYWSALYIPSGLISVLYGLSPVITAILASLVLGEKALTPAKLLGISFGLGGLMVIFFDDLYLRDIPAMGIVASIASVTLHALSAVLVKRTNPGLSGMAITTGAMTVTAIALVPTWLLFGEGFSVQLDARAWWAILYSAVVASVVGFGLYYYVLRNLAASRVALITLFTPVMALLVGHWFNGEVLNSSIWLGTGLIAMAFLCHQWGEAAVVWVWSTVRGREGA